MGAEAYVHVHFLYADFSRGKKKLVFSVGYLFFSLVLFLSAPHFS